MVAQGMRLFMTEPGPSSPPLPSGKTFDNPALEIRAPASTGLAGLAVRDASDPPLALGMLTTHNR
jgi:hypothetical protein